MDRSISFCGFSVCGSRPTSADCFDNNIDSQYFGFKNEFILFKHGGQVAYHVGTQVEEVFNKEYAKKYSISICLLFNWTEFDCLQELYSGYNAKYEHKRSWLYEHGQMLSIHWVFIIFISGLCSLESLD